jgi:hypothetical protein
MAIESENAASSRCGERMRIFRCGSYTMILDQCHAGQAAALGAAIS